MSLVKSMTGYGRAVETVNGREFTVELRSVNNRYLDCTVKLPRSLSFGEDAVKQAVKNVISRGKVDVFLSVRSEGAADVKVTLNASMVEGYLAAMKQMAENFGVKEDISVSLLSRMPDVFTVEKPEVDEQQLLDDLLSGVNKALASTPCAPRRAGRWKTICAAGGRRFCLSSVRWKRATPRPWWTIAPVWKISSKRF